MSIRSTLNRSLLLPILSLVAIAVVVVGVATYLAGNAQLERRIQTLSESSAVLFEDLLWQMDYDTLQVLLDEYVLLGAITSAHIDAGLPEEIWAGSEQTGPDGYLVSRELLHRSGDSVRQIGRLTLETSRDGVWDLVKFSVAVTLLVAILAALATTFIIQHLLNRGLVEPVLAIANGLDSWFGDWRDFRIDLGRGESPGKHQQDELDRLVDAIHGMRDQILTADRVIESKEGRLLSAARIAGIGYATFELETENIVECDEIFASIVGQTVDDMLRFNIRQDIVGKRVHPDDIEQAEAIRQQLRQGLAAEGVFRVATAAGEYRYVRQLFSISPNGEGQATRILTVAQDVTELHHLQATLIQAQKVKAIGNLTGGVAHDFNNILAVISGNLELLEDIVDDPLAIDYLHTSQHAVNLGAELTQQLLAFARKQPLRPEVLDIARMIRKSLPLLRTSVGESVDLDFVTDGGLWRAEVDPTQLEAAILNLIINARDAMPDGGKLTIEAGNARLDRHYADLHEEVEPGQYVCIAISDTGVGMSEATISQALEPFFTTKDVGRGTGLGLPMAFGFAKQSGGHLKIYSEPGRGTTVKLYLPRMNGSQEAARSTLVGRSAASLEGLQVFLVEDSTELRETFTTQLQQMGAVVHGAPDGDTVFAMALGIPCIDLILCDVILPNGMKGPDVVSGLQEIYPEAAVVYMSGYTENAIIHQGRLDEGVIMLQKPFSRRDLLTAFTSAMAECSADG
ncbi:ATP-binding protein [Granulosicoccus sp. 3-233]|uniref:ATP-binding protein n=1 Tax=Granulosicoccus sp. 3-233 TaxID=3417969 RepID=UPI003D345676